MEIKTEELKRIQIEILKTVHKFCISNNINYWLDCGTLLGAIRHKGYIPWDDDIDIGMLRSDYDRFAKEFNNENLFHKFLCVENDKDYCLAHGKVVDTRTILYEPDKKGRKLAVNIDVFVYDNAPDDDQKAFRMYKVRDFYRACNTAHSQKNDLLKGFKRKVGFTILHILAKPFPKNYFAKKMSDNSKKYMNKNTKRVGNFTSYDTILCEKDVFNSFIDAEFEGQIYKIPIGYDKWLRTFYGNYMELPPVEKRVSHHIFKAYYL